MYRDREDYTTHNIKKKYFIWIYKYPTFGDITSPPPLIYIFILPHSLFPIHHPVLPCLPFIPTILATPSSSPISPPSSPSRFPGCPRDDLCGFRFPHDLPEALQLWRCGLQLPRCCLRHPVGPAHAGLVPLSGRGWQDQNWHWEVHFGSIFIFRCISYKIEHESNRSLEWTVLIDPLNICTWKERTEDLNYYSWHSHMLTF